MTEHAASPDPAARTDTGSPIDGTSPPPSPLPLAGTTGRGPANIVLRTTGRGPANIVLRTTSQLMGALRSGGLGWGSILSRLTREPLAVVALCIVIGLGARVYGVNLAYTSDEGYWLHRSVIFGNALLRGDFGATYRSGHPGVTVMWTGLIGMGPERVRTIAGDHPISAPQLEAAPGARTLMSLGRTAISVLTAGLFGLAVVLAGRLLGTPGLLGGALLAADPYTIGMTRLLHVDALLTPLLLVSVLAGLVYWIHGRQWQLLVLSAVTGGLALLTKAPAVTLLPFFGIVWLVLARPWRGGRQFWRAWIAPIVWGLLVAAVYVALWPALWVRPARTLSDVARFAVSLGGAPHLWPTYFLGQPTTGDPGLLFYPIAMALRLGPIATIGLVLLGVLAALRRLTGGVTLLWLLAFVIVFVDVMAVGSKKFDRYMLPALAVLTILGGVGIMALARLVSRRLAISVVALAVVGQGVWLASAYPYPIAAYNPLLGGTTVASRTIMVGWGEGLEQAAAYLNGQEAAGRLTSSTQYHHVLRLIFDGRTVRVPSSRPVDYYVVYVNMVQRNTVPLPVRQAMATTSPVFTAMVHGVPFAWVYQGPFQISSARDVPSETGDDGESETDGPSE